MKARIFWTSVALISLASYFWIYQYLSDWADADIRSIAGTFAAVSGTLLGFVIASLSILAAVVNQRLVMRLRKTGHYDRLLQELYVTAALLLITVIFSLTTLFMRDVWLAHWMAASAASMVASVMWFIVSGRKFALVMQHLK